MCSGGQLTDAWQVFDIEVDEGLTLKCGYNFGQNPYEVRHASLLDRRGRIR